MSQQANEPLRFDLVVYDKDKNQVATFSCDHIARACALAIEQTKLHEGFVIVNQANEFIWKYEHQEFHGLKVARYDREGKRSFIITPPIKVSILCTAPLRNNGFNDFGSMYVKAIDCPELVEHFIGDDDYYIDFPKVGIWLVHVNKYTSASGDGFGLTF